MELKYFEKVIENKKYRFECGDKYDLWLITVDSYGIKIGHGGEHGWTDLPDPDLAEVLIEAVNIYEYLKNSEYS